VGHRKTRFKELLATRFIVGFKQLPETAQIIAFITLLVFVTYSAHLGLVQCVANFDHSRAQKTRTFQELQGTPQLSIFKRF